MSGRIRAYIGLGSNLDDPQAQVLRAAEALRNIDRSERVALSSLYRSDPMGPPDQPDYVNAVAALDTELAPLALLDALQAIEQAHGRVRSLRWGPRTLDLDLLLYGDQVIDSERLTVPHPGMLARNFVLIPLYEIAPGLRMPDNRTLKDFVDACPTAGLERL